MCTIHVQLQRTAWNVGFHMKRTDFWPHFTQFLTPIQPEICQWSRDQSGCYTLHVYKELHINLDSFTFHSVSQRKWSKFHLKIPARESQHILQSNLSQIHSYHGLKRPKREEKNNLWEVCFSSAAVVSKLLLGCSGHFLFILCHCNPTAHSPTCMIHVQTQRTAWNMAFHMKQTFWTNYCKERHFKEISAKIYAPTLYTLNRACEPHITLDSFKFHPVSQRKSSKFLLKIPAREWQHCVQ